MVIKDLSSKSLLELYPSIITELKNRGILRSSNNPVADYAEYLVSKSLGLTLSRKSNKGCDAIGNKGEKYEIKSRRHTRKTTSRRLSIIRDLDSCHFDFLIGVLFDENFDVRKGCIIPFAVAKEIASHSKYQNGWIIHLKDYVWSKDGVVDITSKLVKAQKGER